MARHAAWAVDALPAEDALAAAAAAKAYCARDGAHGVRNVDSGPRRDRQHLGMSGPRPPAPRPPLERDPRWGGRQHGAGLGASRDRGQPWTSVTRPRRRPSEFVCGSGWTRTTRSCRRRRRTTSTGPASAAWHQSLYDGGFLRHDMARGDRWPGLAERLSTSSSTRNWQPPAPRPDRVSATWSKGSSSTGATTAGTGSCPGSSMGAIGGARVSASPTPARTWRHCAPGPSARATSTSSPVTRSGRATPTTPSGASSWPGPTTEVAKHKGISAFAVPMHQPGIEQRPLRMINGITKEFGEVLFDGARVPAAT